MSGLECNIVICSSSNLFGLLRTKYDLSNELPSVHFIMFIVIICVYY